MRLFLQDPCGEEIKLGWFSESSRSDLLSSMYVMPIHVILKPYTDKFHLITNFSAGDFAPNTMIEKSNITNLPLNTISDLSATLIASQCKHSNIPLLMWKSDVSLAYHRMPIQKHWQMKQIHTIEGEHHVNC